MSEEIPSMYRDLVLDEYRHPRNKGAVERPTHEASVRNPLCGDEATITMRVEDGVIKDAKFDGKGCAISQACASLFTEHIRGKTVAEVERMDGKEIVALLGFEPNPARMKCAVLAMRGVAEALKGRKE